MSIPFTEYHPPRGIPTAEEYRSSEEVEEAAWRLIDAGYRFEAEVLTTGQVSLTVVAKVDGEWRDVSIEVVPNGPDVVVAVERLVASATAFMEERGQMTQYVACSFREGGLTYTYHYDGTEPLKVGDKVRAPAAGDAPSGWSAVVVEEILDKAPDFPTKPIFGKV